MGRFVCPHCGGGIDPSRWTYRIETGYPTTTTLHLPAESVDHIAALERDRALLLRYVQATEELMRFVDLYDVMGNGGKDALERWNVARDKIDAGLLEGDDQ